MAEHSKTIWERGVLLASLDEGPHCSRLYQLHNYYIEVTTHKQFNVIRKVCAFTNTELLSPYLEEMEIDDIFDDY